MEKKLNTNKMSFDDQIADKLSNMEFMPSPHVWSKIESELHPAQEQPKGIFWLNKRMLFSVLGAIFFIGFSATGAKFVVKNIAQEYHQEKTNSTTKKIISSHAIAQINQHQKHSGSQELLSSENTQSNSTKLTNYVDQLLGNDAGNRSAESAPSSISESNSTNASETNTANLLDKQSLSEVIMQKLNRLSLMSKQATEIQGELSSKMHQEDDILFISNLHHLKGFFIGPEVGADMNIMPKNNAYHSPILGSNIHYSPNVSVHAGMMMGYNFNDRIGIQTGIQYVNKNQKFASTNYEAPANGTLKLSYIQIPVAAKVIFNQKGPKHSIGSSVNLKAGIQYEYLCRANVTMAFKNAKQSAAVSYDGRQYIANHNLGFNLGVDYDLFVSKQLYWTIGVDGSLTGDAKYFPVWNSKQSFSPSVTFGIHTGIRFFSNGKKSGK